MNSVCEGKNSIIQRKINGESIQSNDSSDLNQIIESVDTINEENMGSYDQEEVCKKGKPKLPLIAEEEDKSCNKSNDSDS